MKRLTVMGAAALVFMSSCSSNDVFENNTEQQQNPISFTAYSASPLPGVKSTAGNLNLDVLKTTGFDVKGRRTSTNADYMSAAVTWASDRWTYTPIIYWPAVDGVLDFMAIGKNATVSDWDFAAANPSFNFGQKAVTAQMEDLVVAYAGAQEAGSSGGRITLQFKHALSKISAEVAANHPSTGVTLKLSSVEFRGLKTSGKLALAKSNGAFTWSDLLPAAGETKALGITSNFSRPGGNETVFTTDFTVNPLFVVPSKPTHVVVKGKWMQGETVVEDFETAGKEKVVALTGAAFESGKHYVYKLTITPDPAPITFEVNVIDWVVSDEAVPVG